MKKLLTVVLGLVVLPTFAGLGAVQERKAQEQSPPTGGQMKQPVASGCDGLETGGTVFDPFQCEEVLCKGDKGSQTRTTAKVTRVDDKLKTFTIKTSNGERLMFEAVAGIALPKVGETINITNDARKVVTVKVARADEKAQTFTIETKGGGALIFNGVTMRGFPKVGDTMPITYRCCVTGAGHSFCFALLGSDVCVLTPIFAEDPGICIGFNRGVRPPR